MISWARARARGTRFGRVSREAGAGDHRRGCELKPRGVSYPFCERRRGGMPAIRRSATPPPSTAPYAVPPPRPCVDPRSSPPHLFTFAPNVAAESYNEPPPLIVPRESTLFPSAPLDGDGGPAPRKASHARKKPDDWIPRPPNAFILFRSEVRPLCPLPEGI